jgi:hypothetical protein
MENTRFAMLRNSLRLSDPHDELKAKRDAEPDKFCLQKRTAPFQKMGHVNPRNFETLKP